MPTTGRRETPDALRADDRASVPAAALAAAAESGVLFVPVHLIAIDSVGVRAGLFSSYPLFAAVFVVAVAAATAFRRHAAMRVAVPSAAVAFGVVQGALWGSAGASAIGTAVVLSLAVALRVVMLGIRDWREPIGDSFVLGGAVLLIEVIAVGSGDPLRRVMPLIAAVFFMGSLASRAGSVWLAHRPSRAAADSVESSLTRPHRSLVVVLAVLGLLFGVALVLGAPNGALEISGGFVYGLLAKFVLAMGWVVAQLLLRPLYWLLTKAHVSAEGLSRAAARIRGISAPSGGQGSSWVERIIGFVLFSGLFLLLVITIRRRWQLLTEGVPRGNRDQAPERATVPTRMRKGRLRSFRRELPADAVRRWYAEALIELERLGLAKPPSRTPGEYLTVVTDSFPASASGFTSLTRAYEDVRYGSISLDANAMRRLEAERDLAMEALSRARRIDDPDQARP